MSRRERRHWKENQQHQSVPRQPTPPIYTVRGSPTYEPYKNGYAYCSYMYLEVYILHVCSNTCKFVIYISILGVDQIPVLLVLNLKAEWNTLQNLEGMMKKIKLPMEQLQLTRI